MPSGFKGWVMHSYGCDTAKESASAWQCAILYFQWQLYWDISVLFSSLVFFSIATPIAIFNYWCSFSLCVFFFKYLYIWLHQVLIVAWGLFAVGAGFSLVEELRLSSYWGLHCHTALEILVLGPEIRLVSPALQGRFLTTGPPGSPFDVSLTCLC